MNAATLAELLNKLKGARILAFGDVMIDEFLYGRVNRISPEAPVPILEYISHAHVLGGAANAAAGVLALGGRASVVGCIGRDVAGDWFMDQIRAAGLSRDGIVVDPKRQTTLKTRVIAGTQHVVRIDRENVQPLDARTATKLADKFGKLAEEAGAILISDYQKGAVSPALAAKLIKMAAKLGLPVVADTKAYVVDHFKGAAVLTPNVAELERMSGVRVTDERALARAAGWLLETTAAEAVLVTRSEKGMTLFKRREAKWHLPAHSIEVHDVTGAGDTVASSVAMGLAAGLGLEQTVSLANYAAAVVVRKVGTALAYPAEILHLVEGEGDSG